MAARPWSHAPTKVFYGPYNGTQNAHSVSLCPGTFFIFFSSSLVLPLSLCPRRILATLSRPLSIFSVPGSIVAAVYCNGPREERAIRGQGKGQKEGQQTVGETFIFTRSPRARLRWYNSCLRDYLFSLKRLPVGGFSRQAIGPQGRKPCLKVAPPYRCLTHGPSSCTLIMRICLSVRTC